MTTHHKTHDKTNEDFFNTPDKALSKEYNVHWGMEGYEEPTEEDAEGDDDTPQNTRQNKKKIFNTPDKALSKEYKVHWNMDSYTPAGKNVSAAKYIL